MFSFYSRIKQQLLLKQNCMYLVFSRLIHVLIKYFFILQKTGLIFILPWKIRSIILEWIFWKILFILYTRNHCLIIKKWYNITKIFFHHHEALSNIIWVVSMETKLECLYFVSLSIDYFFAGLKKPFHSVIWNTHRLRDKILKMIRNLDENIFHSQFLFTFIK